MATLRWTNFLAAMLALAAVTRNLCAQTATATVTGLVTDSQTAVIAGAKVLVTNEATKIQRESRTGQDGFFTVTALPPGSYSISIEAPGFKRDIRSGVVLQVDQQARLVFTLQVGEITEQITVEATSTQLSAENATVGQVVDNRQIVELPLNGRQFLQLASLAPGVATSTSYGARQGGMRGAATNISVNGTRAEFNNYLLDGTTNTDGNWNIMVTSPSVDTLQEFKIQTNAYSAEFGRSAGAQINAVTKSGGNEFHGSLYEFLRNDKFDARNYFAPAGQRKPPYRQNQFGLSAGGPVLLPKFYHGRNRTFFFFNYEGLRIRQAQNRISSVPTPALRRGDFSSVGRGIYDPATTRANPAGAGSIRDLFPGAVIPAARHNPAAVKFLALYPEPNSGAGLVNNYVDTRGQRIDSNQYTIRTDHQFSPRNTIFFRYIFTQESRFSPGSVPVLAEDARTRPQNASFNYTRVFSPTLLNEFKAGFLRLKLAELNLNATRRDVGRELGLIGTDPDPRAWGVPAFITADFNPLGDTPPTDQANNTFQILNHTSWIRGRHNVRWGFEVRRFQFNLYSIASGTLYYFDGAFFTRNPATNRDGYALADLLLGAPRRADRNIGDTQSYFRRYSHNFYIQDDWRVTSRLTLNLGLRYELAMPFTEKRDHMITVDPRLDGFVLVRAGKGDPYEGFSSARLDPSIRYVRDGRFGAKSVNKRDVNNWAPRFGFAWDPTGKQVWSVRGGFGVFYSEDFANPFFDMARNAPKAIRQAFDSNPLIPEIRLESAFGDPKDPITFPRIFSVAYDLPLPYLMQWSFMVQRQLPSNWLLEMGYSGSAGHKISIFQILNLAPPGPGTVQPRRRPSPEIGTVSPIAPLANSNYHSYRLRVEKRYSGGLSLIYAYTFSKSIDDGNSRANTGQGDFAQNPSRQDLERALSDYDVRHVMRLGSTWDIPAGRFYRPVFGGWQVGGILNVAHGRHFTVRSTGNANTGVAGLRANLAPGQNWRLPSDQRSPQRWFNTAAFAPPPPFTFGNTGRNIVLAPGQFTLDFSLAKNFAFSERHRIQFRAESFNTPNHPNFGLPNATAGASGFGTITSASPGRQIQFALKYIF